MCLIVQEGSGPIHPPQESNDVLFGRPRHYAWIHVKHLRWSPAACQTIASSAPCTSCVKSKQTKSVGSLRLRRGKNRGSPRASETRAWAMSQKGSTCPTQQAASARIRCSLLGLAIGGGRNGCSCWLSLTQPSIGTTARCCPRSRQYGQPTMAGLTNPIHP